MPCGTALMKSAVALLTAGPSSRMLAPFAMTTPMPMAGLPFCRTTKVRRIDKAVGDGRDVAEAEHAAVGLDRRLGDRLGAVERTGDAQRHALRCGFHDAGRHHRVLPGKRLEYLVGRDAKRRQLGVGKLDVDLLVLRAVEIDLGDVLDLQQALAQAPRRPFSSGRSRRRRR